MRVGECASLARLFVFYHAGRRRCMHVGVRRNDNLFCGATHIRMNLLTNLWLQIYGFKTTQLRGKKYVLCEHYSRFLKMFHLTRLLQTPPFCFTNVTQTHFPLQE